MNETTEGTYKFTESQYSSHLRVIPFLKYSTWNKSKKWDKRCHFFTIGERVAAAQFHVIAFNQWWCLYLALGCCYRHCCCVLFILRMWDVRGEMCDWNYISQWICWHSTMRTLAMNQFKLIKGTVEMAKKKSLLNERKKLVAGVRDG